MARKDIVVIGGSAGSGPVLKSLLGALPKDLRAAIFIVTHLPHHTPSVLPQLLQNVSPLPVARATDGLPVELGKVVTACSDRHLLLIGGVVRLGDGPRENMVRPAIDPLFRSAALAYGPRVVGVILSGMLSDGASGLWAIKRCGGTAVVQHPLDARESSMPLAALEAVDADEVVPAEALAGVITALVGQKAGPERQAPADLAFEVDVAGGSRLGTKALSGFAEPTPMTCPECQGVLSELKGEGPLRFRWQIGHAFSAETLASRHEEGDHALKVAMRMM
ncbi:MAG: chemotaxis protein CheB, partial [Caulobacteraceae bacterium]